MVMHVSLKLLAKRFFYYRKLPYMSVRLTEGIGVTPQAVLSFVMLTVSLTVTLFATSCTTSHW